MFMDDYGGINGFLFISNIPQIKIDNILIEVNM
jgi:hypothetical protein